MPDTRRRAALLGGVLLIAVAIIMGWRVRSDNVRTFTLTEESVR